MNQLQVWLRSTEKERINRAGLLVTTDPIGGGEFDAEFAYDATYSEPHDLDPASLPRDKAGAFRAQSFQPPLAAFDDALPDAWGQRLLRRRLNELGVRPTKPQMLRHLGVDGLGALVFQDGDRAAEPEVVEGCDSLVELLAAAEKFERGELDDDDKFRRLLRAGGTAGGARPKALIVDEGVHWISKFPSVIMDEGHDVVALEAVSMELARRAGLHTAETKLQIVGSRRVLLVRRFDVTKAGGRRHMVSFKTLCRERPGVQAMGYDELAMAIRKYSASPAADLGMFFRQAVCNAALGNVDDHVKNFWMVLDEGGWRLSPAFDLVPDFLNRTEHCLSFGLDLRCPTREMMEALGRKWGVDHPGKVIDDVADAISGFSALAGEIDVRSNTDAIAEDIGHRVARLMAGRH